MTEAGKKFDAEKVRVELLPFDALIEVGKGMTFGATKYGDNNWRGGLKWTRCLGAALRHLFAWGSGETFDPESGINHLAHAACSILFLLHYKGRYDGLDDRPIEDFTFTMGQDVKAGKLMGVGPDGQLYPIQTLIDHVNFNATEGGE